MNYKAISLWQPWASMLVKGVKRVETRAWRIPDGVYVVHAAKTWNERLHNLARYYDLKEATKKVIGQLGASGDGWSSGARRKLPHPDLPFGCLIGMVTVKGGYPTERVGRWEGEPGGEVKNYFADPLGVMGPQDGKPYLFVSEAERLLGDYSPARWAMTCSAYTAFATPLPYTGRQGIFEVPAAALKGCGELMTHGAMPA